MSCFQLLLYHCLPGVCDSGNSTLVYLLHVLFCQVSEIGSFKSQSVYPQRLDPIKNENLKLFDLIQEFSFQSALFQSLEIFLIDNRSNHCEAVSVLEIVLDHLPNLVLLLGFRTLSQDLLGKLLLQILCGS